MKKTEKSNFKPFTFVILFIASLSTATGVALFLAPVNLLDSGITGLAFLLDRATPSYLIMSYFLIICNFPFFIIGYKKLGKEFVLYSLFAITIFSATTYLYRNVFPIDFSDGSPITHSDMLLSAIFGGLLSGTGSGLVIRVGGAIDGVEVMAVMFAKKLGTTVGSFIMAYNIVLYGVAAIVLKNWMIPLYSVLAYTVGIKTIDFIVDGLDKAKAVFIITDNSAELQRVLSETLGRGVTAIGAKGYYSQDEKTLIYCVVNRFEVRTVKNIVRATDGSAFVTISDVSETIGGEKMLGFDKI